MFLLGKLLADEMLSLFDVAARDDIAVHLHGDLFDDADIGRKRRSRQ
jgi:hypothetical protein